MNRRARILATLLLISLLLMTIVPVAGASAPVGKTSVKTLLGNLKVPTMKTAAAKPTSFEVVAAGLNNPRGLAFGPDGSLYISEAGVGGDGPCANGPEGEACYGPTGSITRVRNGVQERIVVGLPSLAAPDGSGAGGIQDVAVNSAGQVFGIIGLGADPAVRAPQGPFGVHGMEFGQLIGINNDGTWTNLVDVAAHESVANPDGGEVDSNPTSLLVHGNGFAVADAGGNDLVSINASGEITTMAVFTDRMVEFPPSSGNMIPMQAVPTSVQMGSDGAYYVGQLTGFPFPVGGANVYRVPVTNTVEVTQTGFTNILDIAFGEDGSLYVLEMAHNSLLSNNPTGAIYRIESNGTRSLVTSDLFLPTGMTIGPDGALYVSNYGVFPGFAQVVRIGISDMIMATPDTAMVGSTVDVHVHAMNYADDATGVLHIAPLDADLVSYVPGSATNGAFPIGIPVGKALEQYRQGGLAALKATKTESNGVTAVAWLGNQMNDEEVHFGFQVMVEPAASGGGASLTVNSYQNNRWLASASTILSVPELRTFDVTLQNGANGYGGATDTFINAWSPDTPYGTWGNLYVRQPAVKSPLVKFDLSSIPNIAQVTKAQVGVYVTFGGSSSVTMEAYEAFKPWTEGHATWKQADSAMPWEVPGAMGPTDKAASYSDRIAFSGGGKWVWFDVTHLAQMWVQNPDSNNGVIIVGTGATNAELELTSSNYHVASVRPQFMISYQAP